MPEPEKRGGKTMFRFDFPPGAGPDEIAAAIRKAHDRVMAEKEPSEKKNPDDSADPQPQSILASVWESATESLSNAAAAISDATSDIADKAVEIGTASVELTTATTKQIAHASVNAFSGIGLTSAIEYLDDAIDQQAIKTAITDAADAVGDKLDQVTGKQLVEMLEAKLRRQDEYNDILATRLAEAIQRITALEKRLGQ